MLKMDLLETTLKVIENRSVAKENLTLFKQDLDQYEDYINQLRDNLQETQSISSKSTEILEINNFSKKVFNENSKEAKVLFGIIYEYAQQIRQKMCEIKQSENSLNDLSNENVERLKRIETNFNNTFKIFEIMRKDLAEKASKESSGIQDEINRAETEYKECEKMWKNIMDQHEEKQKALQSIRMEMEILEDHIDLEVQQQDLLMHEKKQESRRKVEEVSNGVELRDKTIEIEEGVLATNQKLIDILETKGAVTQKLTESQGAWALMNLDCMKIEGEMQHTENDMKKETEKLRSEIDLKESLLRENEVKIAACKSKECDINNDIEEINSKMSTLDEELVVLHRDFTENEIGFCDDILEKIIEDHNSIVQNSQKLAEMVAANEMKIREKQVELDAVRATSNPEVLEIREKLQALEADAPRKAELEKELEQIDVRNKALQQSVALHQKTIEALMVDKNNAELEHRARQQDLQNIILQYENMVQEVRRLENLRQERIQIKTSRTFQKPTQLIKPPSQTQSASKIPLQTKPATKVPPQTKPATKILPQTKAATKILPQTKAATKNPHTKPATKKRGFLMDVESDGSVDGGERLSYAEFMAKKKKVMKDSKRPSILGPRSKSSSPVT